MKLKGLKYGRDIRAFIRQLIFLSKQRPAEFPLLYTKLESVIFELPAHTKKQPFGKGEYVLVVGKAPRGFMTEAKRVALQYGVKNIRFENDLDKLKNGSAQDMFSSIRCVGVIIGAVPHSIAGGLHSFSHKTIIASAPNTGTRKLTIKTFRSALLELLAQRAQ